MLYFVNLAIFSLFLLLFCCPSISHFDCVLFWIVMNFMSFFFALYFNKEVRFLVLDFRLFVSNLIRQCFHFVWILFKTFFIIFLLIHFIMMGKYGILFASFLILLLDCKFYFNFYLISYFLMTMILFCSFFVKALVFYLKINFSLKLCLLNCQLHNFLETSKI